MKKNITLRMYPEIKVKLEAKYGGIQAFLDKCIDSELGKVTKTVKTAKEKK